MSLVQAISYILFLV